MLASRFFPLCNFLLIFCSLESTKGENRDHPRGLVPLYGGPKRSLETRYWVSTFEATWLEAQLYCRYSGRSLLAIETDREQDLIEYYLELNGYGERTWGWWTSLNDIKKEGEFFWFLTHERALYTNWIIDENGANRNSPVWDCVILSQAWYYHWQIRSCFDKILFICEE